MKYKFLLNIFKNSKEYKLFKSERNTDDIQYDIYCELTKVKFDLENEYDRKFFIIDKFLDGLYLSKALFDTDINKVYKTLVGFIKKCSVEDFRVLYLFRLKVYDDMLKEDSPYEYCYLVPYVALTVVCGGIFYIPLNVGDKVINLSKDLDELTEPSKFFNNRLVKEDFNLKHYYYKNTDIVDKSLMNKMKTEIMNNCAKKSLRFINTYVEKLLSIYNCLHIPAVNINAKDYIDLDLFKLVIKNVDIDLGEAIYKTNPKYISLNLSSLLLDREKENSDVEFKFPSLAISSDFSTLRERKYLLPKTGVIVLPDKFENDSSLVLEGYDNLIGYYICQLVNNTVDKHFNLFSLKTNISNVYIIDVSLLSLFNLYEVPYAPAYKSRVILKENTDGLRWLNMEDVFKAAYDDNDSVVKRIYGNNYVFEEINVKVLKPNYWKYKEDCIVTERKGHNINKNLLAEKIVKVNAFKRKLPSGSKRSDNADMLSKKYCIDLNEDETIVSPFERKQKVKL